MKHCSKCERPRDRNGRYCKSCHAEWMRNWRKSHPLTEEQKVKDRARSYAHEYLKRGKIKRKACRDCGEKAQMHHPDYSKPLKVIWLCRKHHLAEHGIIQTVPKGQ